MRDRACSKIPQAEKRIVRSLAHLANRFHACGIERITDPGRKSNVLNEGNVRKLRGRIEHRPRDWPRGPAQAFSICMERLLSLFVVGDRILSLTASESFSLSRLLGCFRDNALTRKRRGR